MFMYWYQMIKIQQLCAMMKIILRIKEMIILLMQQLIQIKNILGYLFQLMMKTALKSLLILEMNHQNISVVKMQFH